MNKEQINGLFEILNSVYDGFLPENAAMRKAKKIVWYNIFKEYDYKAVEHATYQMMKNKIYGKEPKPADLIAILTPTLEKQNLGLEFASDVWGWLSSIGTERMEFNVLERYGEIGHAIYKRNKHILREAQSSASGVIKAQLRDEFNSMYEREKVQKMAIGTNQDTKIGIE